MKKRCLTLLLAICMLAEIMILPTHAALTLGSASVSDSWGYNDGSKVAVKIYLGNSANAGEINSHLEPQTVYLAQGAVNRYTVPTLAGYLFNEAIVLHKESETPYHAHPVSWVFLNDGKTYWHYYNDFEQGDDLTGVELGPSDRIVLCYRYASAEKPIKVSVVDPDGKAANRIVSAPAGINMGAADKSFAMQISTEKGYRAIVTAGWTEGDQRADGVVQVDGTTDVYRINANAIQGHEAPGSILYVTVSYQPIEKIRVNVDMTLQTNWSDFYMMSSQKDPAALAEFGGEKNSYAKFFHHFGDISVSPSYIAFAEATEYMPGAEYTARSDIGNTVYIAILTNNSMSEGNLALVNLEVNGTALNLPEKYSAYVDPGVPDPVLLPVSERKAVTTLLSGIQAELTLEESPHYLPAGGGYFQQYAYLLKLSSVYEDVRITGGHFLSTGRLSDGENRRYGVVPRTLQGVDLEYRYGDTGEWTPVSQGKLIDQTDSGHEQIHFRYRSQLGYAAVPSLEVKAVHISNSVNETVPVTGPTNTDGWYYFDLGRFSKDGYTYSYQTVKISAAATKHTITYVAPSDSVLNNLPSDEQVYSKGDHDTVLISNQIPTLEASSPQTFLSWRAYKNNDTTGSSGYLDLYPGDTIPLERLFAYEAPPEADRHVIKLYAQVASTSSAAHDLHQYSIQVQKQNAERTDYENVTDSVLGQGKSKRMGPAGTLVHFLDPQKLANNSAVLSGCYYNASVSTASATITNDNAAVITLKFDRPYVLTYDPNTEHGGQGLTGTSETFAYGAVTHVKKKGDVLSGTTTSTFRGWNTAKDGTGTWINPGTQIAMTADMTLYAIWGASTSMYRINYHSGLDPSSETSLRYPSGSTALAASPAALRFQVPGKKYFVKWTTTEDGSGTSYTEGEEIRVTGDLDLYAQWADKPTVTYDANGGAGGSIVEYYQPGEQVNIRTDMNFTKDNCIQSHWNTQSDGSGYSYPVQGGSFTIGTESVTFYAQWVELCTVTYDGNGNTGGEMQPEVYAKGAEIRLSRNSYEKSQDGITYRFTGWNTAADGSGTPYRNRQALILQGNLTLYAQWEPICVVSYYDGYGNDFGEGYGNGFSDRNWYRMGAPAFPVFAQPYVRAGYTFTGWATTPFTTADPSYPAGGSSRVPITGNLNLFAQWQPVQTGGSDEGSHGSYTLRYETNGGTACPKESRDQIWNKSYTALPVPVREGYLFTGWFSDSALKMPVTGDVQINRRTVTLYAGWEKSTVPELLNGNEHYAYVLGYEDGTVRPDSNISRAEVAAIFFRLLKEPVREKYLTNINSFADVTDGMWCNKAVSTLAALGIVKGRSAEQFDPNAPITRGEFAAICSRFDRSDIAARENFTDIDGHWAKEEIQRASGLGWVRGFNGEFRPQDYITRAEAMTMINRVLHRVPESEEDLLPDMITWPDNKLTDWYYLAVQEATNSHTPIRKTNEYESWSSLTADWDWTIYQF